MNMFSSNNTNNYFKALGGRIEGAWQKAFDKARKLIEKCHLQKSQFDNGTGWGLAHVLVIPVVFQD